MRRLSLGVIGWTVLLLGGCHSVNRPDCVRPTIAVMKFENRAAFSYNWDVGSGTADVLVDRLVKTERYHVMERPELDSVMKEIQLQNSGVTRPQDRAKLGQLKNVQFLIKGTITDFGYTGGVEGNASKGSWSIFGSGQQAIMGMTIYVVAVESGEILASERIHEAVSSGNFNIQGSHKDMTFGGGVFYSTPLGKATEHAIDKAMTKITAVIANRPWEPKVAAVTAERMVVINGGRSRGIKAGEAWEILQAGAPITDPDTGDVIGKWAGKVVGRVRITDVDDLHSLAVVETGKVQDFQVGQMCRRCGETSAHP